MMMRLRIASHANRVSLPSTSCRSSTLLSSSACSSSYASIANRVYSSSSSSSLSFRYPLPSSSSSSLSSSLPPHRDHRRSLFGLAKPERVRLKESHVVPYPPSLYFDVVLDVDAYSSFVPFCSSSRVTRRVSSNCLEAELTIGFRIFTERYTSRITYARPQSIQIESVQSSVFGHLVSTWSFAPVDPLDHTKGSHVEFDVDFTVSSPVHAAAVKLFFADVSAKQIRAFSDRCGQLHKEMQEKESAAEAMTLLTSTTTTTLPTTTTSSTSTATNNKVNVIPTTSTITNAPTPSAAASSPSYAAATPASPLRATRKSTAAASRSSVAPSSVAPVRPAVVAASKSSAPASAPVHFHYPTVHPPLSSSISAPSYPSCRLSPLDPRINFSDVETSKLKNIFMRHAKLVEHESMSPPAANDARSYGIGSRPAQKASRLSHIFSPNGIELRLGLPGFVALCTDVCMSTSGIFSRFRDRATVRTISDIGATGVLSHALFVADTSVYAYYHIQDNNDGMKVNALHKQQSQSRQPSEAYTTLAAEAEANAPSVSSFFASSHLLPQQDPDETINTFDTSNNSPAACRLRGETSSPQCPVSPQSSSSSARPTLPHTFSFGEFLSHFYYMTRASAEERFHYHLLVAAKRLELYGTDVYEQHHGFTRSIPAILQRPVSPIPDVFTRHVGQPAPSLPIVSLRLLSASFFCARIGILRHIMPLMAFHRAKEIRQQMHATTTTSDDTKLITASPSSAPTPIEPGVTALALIGLLEGVLTESECAITEIIDERSREMELKYGKQYTTTAAKNGRNTLQPTMPLPLSSSSVYPQSTSSSSSIHRVPPSPTPLSPRVPVDSWMHSWFDSKQAEVLALVSVPGLATMIQIHSTTDNELSNNNTTINGITTTTTMMEKKGRQ